MTEDEADTMMRQHAAATVVGFRIVTGVTAEDMATRMDFLRGAPETGRAREKAVAAAVERLLAVEREMADAHLATYQRYSRALGLSFRPYFPARRPRRRPQMVARCIQRARAHAADQLFAHRVRNGRY
jgi:hypothetical protein